MKFLEAVSVSNVSTHQVSAVGVGKDDPDPSSDFAAPPGHEALLTHMNEWINENTNLRLRPSLLNL